MLSNRGNALRRNIALSARGVVLIPLVGLLRYGAGSALRVGSRLLGSDVLRSVLRQRLRRLRGLCGLLWSLRLAGDVLRGVFTGRFLRGSFGLYKVYSRGSRYGLLCDMLGGVLPDGGSFRWCGVCLPSDEGKVCRELLAGLREGYAALILKSACNYGIYAGALDIKVVPRYLLYVAEFFAGLLLGEAFLLACLEVLLKVGEYLLVVVDSYSV